MKRSYLPFLPLFGLLAGCSSTHQPKPAEASAGAKPADPIAVQVAAAQERRVERTIAATGSLVPDETVTVSAEVSGRVSKLYADFGQSVKQGAVVAELDRQELALQLERTRAALAQALARVGLNPDQADATPESSPAIRQARAQLDDARFKFDSASNLVRTGDISRERHNELEKVLAARQAAYDAARDDLRTQLANIQALRAELKLSEKRFNDATVRAPFDGAVSQRMVSPGQYIKENTPILMLVKTHPLRLRAEIPEAAAAAVRVGTSLTFVTDAAPGREFHAVVRELNPALDARSRSLTAEARLVENDSRLRSGTFVQVRLVTARDSTIVAVPKQALYTVAGLTKLFVIRDGKAVELRVISGQEVDGWVEVPAGQVRAGDRVAVSNQAMLTHGAPVQAKG